MKNRGITLLELLVVIVIMGILMTLAGSFYSRWIPKYRLETQVRQLYADLMNARVQALQTNKPRIVRITQSPSVYGVWEDNDEVGVWDESDSRDARFSNDKELRFTASEDYEVATDTRGLLSINTFTGGTIQFETGGVKAEYDCIVVEQTRIRMGVLDNESNCVLR